jgi:hypothetical protein
MALTALIIKGSIMIFIFRLNINFFINFYNFYLQNYLLVKIIY